MSYFGTEDFRAKVLLNEVPRWRIMRGFGERESMGTPVNGEDIWRGSDPGVGGADLIPLIDSAGIVISVKSSSASDTLAGTGIQKLRVDYIRADGSEAFEVVDMNGTTGVALAHTDIIHVQTMSAAYPVGSNGVGVGNVTAYNGSDVYNMIAIGGNQSMTCARMCPAGHKLIVMDWDHQVSSNDRIAYRIRSTDYEGVLVPGVFLFKDVGFISKVSSGQVKALFASPPFSIVKISGWGDQTGGEGSASWWGYLVEDN
ncbi:MAG: hypothetical protein GY930_14960 [bacterium]|nr:hypothetical protein [bacterium]